MPSPFPRKALARPWWRRFGLPPIFGKLAEAVALNDAERVRRIADLFAHATGGMALFLSLDNQRHFRVPPHAFGPGVPSHPMGLHELACACDASDALGAAVEAALRAGSHQIVPCSAALGTAHMLACGGRPDAARADFFASHLRALAASPLVPEQVALDVANYLAVEPKTRAVWLEGRALLRSSVEARALHDIAPTASGADAPPEAPSSRSGTI